MFKAVKVDQKWLQPEGFEARSVEVLDELRREIEAGQITDFVVVAQRAENHKAVSWHLVRHTSKANLADVLQQIANHFIEDDS